MKVKFINTWRSKRLQNDKIEFVLRIMSLTIFAFVGDVSRKQLNISLLNAKFSITF